MRSHCHDANACGLAALLAAWVAGVLGLAARAADAQSPDEELVCRNVRCTREPVPTGDDSLWIQLLRAPLAPPRLLFDAATELLLVVPRIEDEHHLSYRVEDFFFDDARVFGVYPTVFYETGFHPNAGARLVHRDLFGAHERLRIRAGFGGVKNQVYAGDLNSGSRWSPFTLSLLLRFRLSQGARFYGFGNGELRPPGDVRLDPTQSAIESQYGSEDLRGVLGGAWSEGALGISLHQLWRWRDLSRAADDTPSVADVYAGESVALFDAPLVDVYHELRVSWDAQQNAHASAPRELPSSGIETTVWAGVEHVLSTPRRTFGRIGMDLQPVLDLYRGDRVLRLRLRTAWVIGPLSRIPFLDLPQLGGASLLRGYDGARFRGRGTVLASAEYRHPVQENIAGYLFVDAGRACLDVTDVGSLRNPRIGFGGGVYLFTSNAMLLRVQFASSIDGGFFLALKMDTADALGDTY